jgi:CheY-like chemotaxis protein
VNEVLRGAGAGTAAPAGAPFELSTLTRLRAVRESPGRRPLLLVVEDSAEDRDFIAWAFEECEEGVEVRWAESGEEALESLTRGRVRERPALILLDLSLPGRGGLATLATIRRDVSLRTIPVIVFTGSGEEEDILRCYELGANSYFTKPSTMEGYRNIIRILETYWLQKAELPLRS